MYLFWDIQPGVGSPEEGSLEEGSQPVEEGSLEEGSRAVVGRPAVGGSRPAEEGSRAGVGRPPVEGSRSGEGLAVGSPAVLGVAGGRGPRLRGRRPVAPEDILVGGIMVQPASIGFTKHLPELLYCVSHTGSPPQCLAID